MTTVVWESVQTLLQRVKQQEYIDMPVRTAGLLIHSTARIDVRSPLCHVASACGHEVGVTVGRRQYNMKECNMPAIAAVLASWAACLRDDAR
eukprot:scaffold33036_cov35-Prasinocladus_malaysianus.AAC.1